MIKRGPALIAGFCIALSCLPALPQDPASLAAQDVRHYETTLSGVDICNPDAVAELRALTATLGKPSREKDDPKHRLHDYVWESDGPDLKVTVWRLEPQKGLQRLYRIDSIEVWGRTHKGNIGLTSAGLSLGSTLRDARRKYPSLDYTTSQLKYFPHEKFFLNEYATGLVSGRSSDDGCESSPQLRIDFDRDVVVYMKLTRVLPAWDW